MFARCQVIDFDCVKQTIKTRDSAVQLSLYIVIFSGVGLYIRSGMGFPLPLFTDEIKSRTNQCPSSPYFLVPLLNNVILTGTV